jgi:Leucine-rich repeat (LRR) protein
MRESVSGGELLLGLLKLEVLNLSGNGIREFWKESLSSRSLRLLDLSKNQVGEWEVPGVSLPSLRHLNLSGNPLKKADHGMRSDSLNWLDLSSGHIRVVSPSLLEGLTNLTGLDLSENPHVYTLGEFKSKTVKVMIAERCSIEEVSLCGLPSLVKLSLSSNRLRHISSDTFSCLSQLSRLHLDSNQIVSIDPLAFSSLPSLSHLALSHNSLSKLDPSLFTPLKLLAFLDLSRNPLSLLSLRSGVLLGLDASHCEIKAIPSSFFPSNPSLSYLNLSHNSLEEFPPAASRSLRVLDLSYNMLSHLHNVTFLNLTRFNIRGK